MDIQHSTINLDWNGLSLLTDYDAAGAVTFNTNWDLDMFKRGRVGIIIDGTWNTLAVDPDHWCRKPGD